MYSRFFVPPRQSFFLFGPRGTGKSTLIQHLFQNAYRIDLLDDAIYQRLLTNPNHLDSLIEGNPERKQWVIDEVQRVPSLLPLVHAWIEKKKFLFFILTGSSSRKIKRTGADLLGGRALHCRLHGYMAHELGKDFSVKKSLEFGMLPIVWASKEPDRVVDAYLSLYMQLEVQAEGIVRSIESFAKFLQSVSFSHGQMLNYSNVGRDCGVEGKTARAYIEILEDLLLGFRLPVFSVRAKRELVQHEKFYYFDAGIFRAVRPKGFLDSPETIVGAAFEGLILQHVRAWRDYRGKECTLYFWRSRGGAEVDLILYGEEGLFGIEIKSSSKIQRADLKHLLEFRRDYPKTTLVLIYGGKEKLKQQDVWILPAERFLMTLNPALSFEQTIRSV